MGNRAYFCLKDTNVMSQPSWLLLWDIVYSHAASSTFKQLDAVYHCNLHPIIEDILYIVLITVYYYYKKNYILSFLFIKVQMLPQYISFQI